MDKPLLCGKTAKDYKFWDNLMYHYKTLYPLYDKKVDFAQYTSVHDGWLFSNPKNLKLHNKVCKFEQVKKFASFNRYKPKGPRVALVFQKC